MILEVDFWKYSYEKIGLYDWTSQIDYVLNKTNKSKTKFFCFIFTIYFTIQFTIYDLNFEFQVN